MGRRGHRTPRKSASAWSNEVTRNPWVWGAVALCIGLIAMAVAVPVLSQVLSIAYPPRAAWAIILFMSSLPLVVGQLLMLGRRRREGPDGSGGRG